MSGDIAYSSRRNILTRERHYCLTRDGLVWRDERREGRFAYEDVVALSLHKVRLLDPFSGMLARQRRCMVRLRDGSRVVVVSTSYAGFRLIEDRLAAFLPFVRALEERVRARNPNARVASGSHWSAWIGAVASRGAVLLLRLLHRVDPDWLADFCAAWMRRVGPHLAYQRDGRENLRAAFPEKSAAAIEHILAGVWDNLGRLGAEIAHLDTLADFDADHPGRGRIIIPPESMERLVRLRDGGRPALWFGAHLANWELPPLAAIKFHLDGAVVYQRPHMAALGEEIFRIRQAMMGALIPAGAEAPLRIADALKRGVHVGMLVDQHFTMGVDVEFFGRGCKANPTLARLARRFDCPIYGARAIRLPDHRFRLELTEAIEAPRDAEGKIDVVGTMQAITTVVEGWVREHPEQWLWLHRRWRREHGFM
jgi:KDO2-lipid IV(A) lauroyltransferase